jgi:hypothetical protein
MPPSVLIIPLVLGFTIFTNLIVLYAARTPWHTAHNSCTVLVLVFWLAVLAAKRVSFVYDSTITFTGCVNFGH